MSPHAFQILRVHQVQNVQKADAPLTLVTQLNKEATGMWKRFQSMTSLLLGSLSNKEATLAREHEWKKRGFCGQPGEWATQHSWYLQPTLTSAPDLPTINIISVIYVAHMKAQSVYADMCICTYISITCALKCVFVRSLVCGPSLHG